MGQLNTFFENYIERIFGTAPMWGGGAALLIAAALLALVLHRFVLAGLRAVFRSKDAFVRRFFERTKGPTRLALVIIFVSIALGPANLPSSTTSVISHGLLIAVIILIGWILNRTLDVASAIYLNRFRTDVDDNHHARKHITQIRVLRRAAEVVIILVSVAIILTTFPPVREYGISMLASAGAAGIIIGLAARPVLSNLIAGIQIAIAQPIRIEDVVVVEGEWGHVEEITGTYVIIRTWDLRRMIVPLTYFIETPFENWTHDTDHIYGPVELHVDYRAPVAIIREKVTEIAKGSNYWDGDLVKLEVIGVSERTMRIRALASARNSSDQWNLRCEMREKLVEFLQEEHPGALPLQRAEISGIASDAVAPGHEAQSRT